MHVRNSSTHEDVLRAVHSWLVSKTATTVQQHFLDAEAQPTCAARVLGHPREGLPVAVQRKSEGSRTGDLHNVMQAKGIPHQVVGASDTNERFAISGIVVSSDTPLHKISLPS